MSDLSVLEEAERERDELFQIAAGLYFLCAPRCKFCGAIALAVVGSILCCDKHGPASTEERKPLPGADMLRRARARLEGETEEDRGEHAA